MTPPTMARLPASLPFLGLGETRYRSPAPVGMMSRVAAGALDITWHTEPVESEIRRRHAALLLDRLGACRGIGRFVPLEGSHAGFLRLPVRVQDQLRSAFDSEQARTVGVMPCYPESLAELGGFAVRVQNREAGFPGARMLARELFTLPTHSRVGPEDLERLTRWIDSACA